MDVKLELKSILEEILVKPITDAELDLSWDELDLDSLGIIELVMSVEIGLTLR
jgi:acyl carrier protein